MVQKPARLVIKRIPVVIFRGHVFSIRVLKVEVRVDDWACAVVRDGEGRVEEVDRVVALPLRAQDGIVAAVRTHLQHGDRSVVAHFLQSGNLGSSTNVKFMVGHWMNRRCYDVSLSCK